MTLPHDRVELIIRRVLDDSQEPSSHSPGSWRRLWLTYLKPHLGVLTLLLAIMAAWGPLPLAIPLVHKFVIDDVLRGGAALTDPAQWAERLPLLGWAVLWNLLIYGLFFFFHWAQQSAALAVSQRITYALRKDLYEKLQRLHIGFFDRTQTGRLMSRLLDDVNVLQGAASNHLAQLVGQFSKFLGAAIVMYWLNWQLSLALTLVLPFYIGLFLYLRPRIRRTNIAISRMNSRTIGHTEERIAAIRVLQAFNAERREFSRFATLIHDAVRLQVRSAVYKLSLDLFVATLTAVLTGVVIYVGARQIQAGHMSLGAVLAYLGAMSRFFGPIGQVANLATFFQYVGVVLRRVLALMDEPEDVLSGQVRLRGIKGKIEFDAVSFAYPRQIDPALKQISFKIKPGERIALMGPSGAGKTTLFQLLLRFYDPDAGVIRVGGVDLAEANIASLRRHVRMVQQEPFIFSGTLTENLMYGQPDATPEEIRTAAQQAELHDFILSLPEKYETSVGEHGMSLSGGQKQRLALATALLTNPEILLLDDTTSALDAETEAKIRATLEKVLPGHTTLIITQRIATARHCDRILVLENGLLTQNGHHDTLLAHPGFYQRVYHQQESI
jgi:ABC-type multidrug transport system fused ATPase/permease subunit